MMINLHVIAVDGERIYSIQTPNSQEALQFLRQYDHEGSQLQLEIEKVEYEGRHDAYGDSEEIYRILDRM